MSKFLYCSDLHGKAKNPNSRIDNYTESWLTKIKEIQQLAIDNDCRCIIVNGDVFDTPYVSNVLLDDFIDIVENQCTDKKVLWRIVVGNHDLVGCNWEASKVGALAHVFRRCKLIDRLTTIETDDYYIEGMDYFFGIEDSIKEKGLKHDKKTFSVCIPHALIIEKPFFQNAAQVLMKEIDSDFDLVLCGHLHQSFDKTINGTRYLNLNSIGRKSINEQHMPQVAIIDTIKQSVEIIKLKTAKQPEECFDLSHYEEKKANEKGIEEFLASLQGTEWITLDLVGQVEKLHNTGKISLPVKNYLVNKIGEINVDK